MPAPPAPATTVCPAAGAQSTAMPADTPVARVQPVAAARAARGTLRFTRARTRWRAQQVDASDNFNDVDATFDARGALHVAGRGAFRHGVTYWGPAGKRAIEATNDQGSVAIAAVGTTPVVGYGMDHPESAGGRLVSCDVLKLAAGPGLTPTAVYAHAQDDTAFFFSDLAADPATNAVHAIYEVGRSAPALAYRRLGAAPERLPLSGGTLRQAQVAAAGDAVAVAARTDGGLVVFVRRGSGPFAAQPISARAGTFDLAMGRDGRPRIAFVDGAGRLALFNGRRVVRSRTAVVGVAIAVDRRGRMHVAAAPTAQACHTTWIWECTRGGLYHVRTTAAGTRGVVSTIQSTTGFAPGRIAIAVHGTRVAVAYGDPAQGKALTVRRSG